jgi:hypothetical protein
MGYLTINTQSNRVVIISTVITRIFLTLYNAGTVTFQPVSRKTLVNYLCCSFCALCQLNRYLFIVIHYLFIRALCSLLSLIYFVHCSTLLFILLFDSASSILLPLLFIVHCFKKEKFNSDPGLCSGISIPSFQYATSSIQVNKHHTADSTDFALV